MKIYEYIKAENKRTFRLFGLPLMKQTSDYMTLERYQSFCGGIVTTIKLSDPYTDQSKKDIKIFGKSIIKRFEEDGFRTFYLLDIPIKKVSLIEEFKQKYFKYFDKKHDDIYILRANSGEIYLLLTYIINELIKRNQSKTPLLVATQEYHIDMIKMICPNIPYVYVRKMQIRTAEDMFKIDNFRFFYLFSSVHFKQVENNIKENKPGKFHYFKSILDRLNISESDLSMNKIVVPNSVEKSMLKKIQKTGLNLEKFVFLAPEAKSCKLYDEDFWCLLINKFQEKGFDVYVNLVDDIIKLETATNYKKCDLSYAEAFALAKKSKKIVSLRSGLTEFLLQTEVPIDVLYTKFRNRHFFDDMDVEHVMSGFGITQIPMIDKDKVREFNMYDISQNELLQKFLKTL